MSSRDNLFAMYNIVHPLEGALMVTYRGLMLDSCVCDKSMREYITNAIMGE
jgi:hypothetical protein